MAQKALQLDKYREFIVPMLLYIKRKFVSDK